MQAASYQAFTETERVEYPPAWDALSGPTVTRTFEGTVAPYAAVPGAVPVQQAQSVGADIAPLLAQVRESYRNVMPAIEAFPTTTVILEARAHPAERDLGGYDARTIGIAVVFALALAVVVSHLVLTSVGLRALRRKVRQMQRRGPDASAQTPPPAAPR
jgi:hypothetical protein